MQDCSISIANALDILHNFEIANNNPNIDG